MGLQAEKPQRLLPGRFLRENKSNFTFSSPPERQAVPASERRTLPLMARAHIAPTSRLSVDDWIPAGNALLAEEGIKALRLPTPAANWPVCLPWA